MTLRVLALEPYYGGSHRAFLDDWISRSRHRWTLLTLPAHKWKWRMRHAPLTFAEQVRSQLNAGEKWDILFCSDMLSLAGFKGLTPALAAVPSVVYFHENQLTYPVRREEPRDAHYGFTNIGTAIAAQSIWFNSTFHCNEFYDAAGKFIRRMPDFAPFDQLHAARKRSVVRHPGITLPPQCPQPRPGPLNILWAARWEHDKNAADFFTAIDLLDRRGVAFSLSVIGESFRRSPPEFAAARERFDARIVHWGFQPTRQAYNTVLSQAGVVVSTANHEFFGISVIEAIAAGAVPLLPRRLAYPETVATTGDDDPWFYNGSPEHLAERLELFAAAPGGLFAAHQQRLQRTAARYDWNRLAPAYDNALEDASR